MRAKSRLALEEFRKISNRKKCAFPYYKSGNQGGVSTRGRDRSSRPPHLCIQADPEQRALLCCSQWECCMHLVIDSSNSICQRIIATVSSLSPPTTTIKSRQNISRLMRLYMVVDESLKTTYFHVWEGDMINAATDILATKWNLHQLFSPSVDS